MTHDAWMRRALALAEEGRGTTSPNPVVGCVIIRNDQCIAQGAHHVVGGPHAEVVALSSATEDVRGATLYCTLEPCAHTGRTPPCADAIIAAGIGTVVIATRDPNPAVNGRGVEKLRAAGITVVEGICEQDARWVNRGFIMTQREHRPWVIGKVAQTLDGLTSGEGAFRRHITGEATFEDVQQTRAWVDGIMVGAATILQDDPLLTVRDHTQHSPRRIVLDPEFDTRPQHRVFTDIARAPVIIAGAADREASPEAHALAAAGATIIAAPRTDGGVSLPSVLRSLATEHGIVSVLIESGGTLLRAAIQQHMVDELQIYVAPVTSGGGATWMGPAGIAGPEQAWTFLSAQTFTPDVRLTAARTASLERIS